MVAGLLMTAVAAGPMRAGSLPDVSARSPWIVQERNDDPDNGYVLYRRELPGSDFTAFRLEATLDAPASLVADAARKNVADPAAGPRNMTKTILRDDGDVTVVYSYIDMPLVSDRDVTTRAVRSFDPDSGVYRVEWNATDEGPAPREGVVRLEKSSGSWVFTPLPDGRTHAAYESHAEIGGSIPAWLLNSLMNDTVVDGIVHLRARVEQERQHVAAEMRDASSHAR